MNAAPDPLFLALQAALAGRYSLEQEIGRGGMGIVYRARDVQLDRPIALKLLPPDHAKRHHLRDSFLREARLAARLAHPNIVPIYAVEEVEGFVFYAMRLVTGESLGERLRRLQGLSPDDAAYILRDVAYALAYAHAQGIIHRDIKPDNILIDSRDERALVTDFGIARLSDEKDVSGKQIIGTPEYLSPEQAGGEHVDLRTDLYSLGVVGFHCLTGSLPFTGSTREIITKRVTQDPPTVHSQAPHVPSMLAEAIDRAIQRHPTKRFSSAEEMAEALVPAHPVIPELRVPVRIWVERGRGMKGIYIIWSCFFYGIATMALVAGLTFGFNLSEILAMFFCGFMGVAPWVGHGLWRINETRRALEAGVSLDELRHGVEVALLRSEEELRFEASRPVHWIARTIRRMTYLSFFSALFWLFSGAVLGGDSPASMIMFALFSASALLTAAGATFGLVFPGRRVGPHDSFARLRRRFWSGKIGETMVKLASIGLKRQVLPPKWATWQPAESALGTATNRLFEALPSKERAALADLPSVIARLEQDAMQARVRMERGESGVWSDRLHQAVAAIENLRLGMMRMASGYLKQGGSLTADLNAARELSERIEYQLSGADEAETFARELNRTPGSIRAVPITDPPA